MVKREHRTNLTAMLGVVFATQFGAALAATVSLTPERMSQLQQVNTHVNSTITEVSDLELYGREDVWALPVNGKGDCEDFALLKRTLLVQKGWPASALRVAAVHTPEGEAHAVLSVATDKGNLVLDNKVPTVRPEAATGYTFLSRQSGVKPGRWVAEGSGAETSTPVADFPVSGKARAPMER